MMPDDVAYCINGDGRVAVGGETIGVHMLPEWAAVMGDGGLVETVELKCAVCLGLTENLKN